MCTTAVTGYMILMHMQLYQIYPVLIAIPTIVVACIVHFFVQSGKASSKVALVKMLHVDEGDGKMKRKNKLRPLHKETVQFIGSASVIKNSHEIDSALCISSDIKDVAFTDQHGHELFAAMSDPNESSKFELSSDDGDSENASIKQQLQSKGSDVEELVRGVFQDLESREFPEDIAVAGATLSKPHRNRRESVQQGLSLLSLVRQELNEKSPQSLDLLTVNYPNGNDLEPLDLLSTTEENKHSSDEQGSSTESFDSESYQLSSKEDD
jgi:hypothetical protein